MTQLRRFVWFELMTTDPTAAPGFYEKVLGWGTQKFEGGMDYTMWTTPVGPVGGLTLLPEEAKAMGAPPHWLGYVGVADVDATAGRVTQLGGTVYVPPTDIPDAGRFAVFADPTGAAFGVHGGAGEGTEPSRDLGQFGWVELATSDPDAAWAFYSELFGWQKSTAMDMGGMGVYQMFGPTADPESMIGGMMRQSPEVPVSAWFYYVRVADAEAAAAVVRDNGGQVLYGPMDIPGGGRAAMFLDPQGVAFGVFTEPKG